MKPRYKGWKEGIIKEDLKSVGGTVHKKGSVVRYKRHRVYAENSIWTGEYEWHYVDLNNYNLVRTSELLIE